MSRKRLSAARCPVAALLTLLWMAGGIRARAQSADAEYRIKAAFLFHFAQLVDWPEDALQASSTINLCTFGTDPFRGALETTVAGKAIAGRTIQVRHLRQAGDIPGCHVLFIGQAEGKQIPGLLADLHNAPVLTQLPQLGARTNYFEGILGAAPRMGGSKVFVSEPVFAGPIADDREVACSEDQAPCKAGSNA